ncbi:uncharacterized protein BX663DRAFT_526643 [Cokeromyces recurvatus]|uniref:uncharacterized protein n=1 Tax=Cokeromyces recurvatus TaxID=90255 RepID=UPI00221F0140|nr:uncharacterized protein BX663DRAFT_526643 [Cokeromyces recurvatus]KAI7897975.1 hypothetical protein BX663DRAFT_526643 [Cokeromyces recurvatus]
MDNFTTYNASTPTTVPLCENNDTEKKEKIADINELSNSNEDISSLQQQNEMTSVKLEEKEEELFTTNDLLFQEDYGAQSQESKQPLTAELLAEQNELYSNKLEPKPNAIRAWAADLPEVPDTVQPILTSTHIFEMDSLTMDDEKEEDDSDEIKDSKRQPCIQETKDVFSETQKIAYVGLCYLTSLEVVHDYQGKDFTYARMSADNWQRKIMRILYVHMDISSDEIKMIESLSRHKILPTDLVHQFTSQGETAEVKLGDLNTKQKRSNIQQDSDDRIIVDLRWTVMCDLFLICLSTENYDARSRVFVARIASYLSLDWFQVIDFEKRITEHLVEDSAWETETVTSVATTVTNMTLANIDPTNGFVKNDVEKRSRNRERKKRRYIMVGLATISGGLILGLSAGLMAPVIAGGIGAILTTVGVTGTGSFLGGTAGIALITGGATVAGGRIGGRSMNKRMKTINTFEFIPVYTDENANCIISITGWLPNKDKEESSLPFSVMDTIMGDHYTLYWEPEMLEELGSAFRILATEAVTFSIQQALAHTIMGALLAGLAWPLALTKLGYMVDNPWANGLDRSRLAGLILADALMNRNLGARPITLVGYSLGARVIFFCLLELARMKAYGLIENVFLFGTPVSASKTQWKECTTVVSGRFVNGYATNDWLLGFLFRTSTAGLGNIAGLRPLLHIEGNRVLNVDCTDLVSGHLSYRSAMPKLLKRAGFVVTSEELPVKEKDKGRSENSSTIEEPTSSSSMNTKNKHLDSVSSKGRSSISSFSSSKASIQYQIKQTTLSSADDNQVNFQNDNTLPTRTNSSSIIDPATPGNQTPSYMSYEKQEPTLNGSSTISDMDIIADIIANATAAASSKSGTYSSLSSGKASIATSTVNIESTVVASSSSSSLNTSSQVAANRTSAFTNFFNISSRRSKSETILASEKPKITPRSSLLSSSFFGNSKKKAVLSEEWKEVDVEVKEIKSTLGTLVVPKEIINPMPKIKLEAPQHARLNR